MSPNDRREFDEAAREVPEGVDATDVGGWLVLDAAERRKVYIARTHVLRVRPNHERADTDRERVLFLQRRR